MFTFILICSHNPVENPDKNTDTEVAGGEYQDLFLQLISKENLRRDHLILVVLKLIQHATDFPIALKCVTRKRNAAKEKNDVVAG